MFVGSLRLLSYYFDDSCVIIRMWIWSLLGLASGVRICPISAKTQDQRLILYNDALKL